MGVQITMRHNVYISFKYVARSEISALYMVVLFYTFEESLYYFS